MLGDTSSVRVIERPGLVAALISSSVSEARFVAAYDAAVADAANETADSSASRRRVSALKRALGDLHASDGAFAVVAFDENAGRVLAARTANAAPLHYGFTRDGALVASGGLTAARLFPDAGDALLQLTPLPSGRFVFGHRFVKPIEFTRFWDTAEANRAAAPARDAFSGRSDDAAGVSRRRWGDTGTAADSRRRWTAAPAAAASATSPALKKVASVGVYVPPSLRKAREAAAAATAAAAAAEAAPVSPRAAARAVDSDAQVAEALAAQDAVVSSLSDALVAAVAKAPSRRCADHTRRASLRSNTFTLGRAPGAGAEAKLGRSGLGKLRAASFRVAPAGNAAAPATCVEAEAGFASFKANLERMAALRGPTAA